MRCCLSWGLSWQTKPSKPKPSIAKHLFLFYMSIFLVVMVGLGFFLIYESKYILIKLNQLKGAEREKRREEYFKQAIFGFAFTKLFFFLCLYGWAQIQLKQLIPIKKYWQLSDLLSPLNLREKQKRVCKLFQVDLEGFTFWNLNVWQKHSC